MNRLRGIQLLIGIAGILVWGAVSPVLADDPPLIPQPYLQKINVLFVRKNQDGEPVLDPNDQYSYLHDPAISPNPQSVAFEGLYLPNVVAQEIGNSVVGPRLEARKAQAIAARGFAWHKQAYRSDPPDQRDPCFTIIIVIENTPRFKCDVTNSTDDQDYAQGRATPLDFSATTGTFGQVLLFHPDSGLSDKVSLTQYSKGHPTQYTIDDSAVFPTDLGYLDPVFDPIQTVFITGHGVGLSQDGAIRWEVGNTNPNYGGTPFPFWNYAQILAHYYRSVELRNGISPANPLWPPDRWNMLQLTPADGIFYEGEARQLMMALQNTGIDPWPADTTLHVRWKRLVKTAGVGTPLTTAWTSLAAVGGVVEADDIRPSFSLTPPAGLFQGTTNYTYLLEWDLKRTTASGPRFFKDDKWFSQEWGATLRRRVTAPPPKQKPNPNCSTGPVCALRLQGQAIAWEPVSYAEPISYRWRLDPPSGPDLIVTTNDPTTAPLTFQKGQSAVYARTLERANPTNLSAETLVATVLYDPDPPQLTLAPIPRWTNAAQLTLNWTMSDAMPNVAQTSGIAQIQLEQRINTGNWTTLLASPTATTYTTAPLNDNATYTYRFTLRDGAGNVTVQDATVSVDRTPSAATLLSPSGPLTRTWTLLTWSTSGSGAPITGYALEQQQGSAWVPLFTRVEGSSPLLFVGQPNTLYALRIRAIDAAGNQEAPLNSPEITFTTGASRDGLHSIYYPLIILDADAQRDSEDL